MKACLLAVLGIVAVLGFSRISLAECQASMYGDYEEYDYDDYSQVENFCNGHARNFEIIRVGKDEPDYQAFASRVKAVEVQHWGEIKDYMSKEALTLQDEPSFDDYCFYVQRRSSGGWGRDTYKYDARFYYNISNFRGRGQWDIFRAFEEYSWYRVYKGWNYQVRLHFPNQCDDYNNDY